jgi:hypothetical protein
MANLIDQINEMIDILEVINPTAAAQFRRGGPQQAPAPSQPAPIEARQQTAPTPPRIQSVRPAMPVAKAPPAAPQPPAVGLQQLKLNLNPGKMAEALILAEIIGKPIAKRRHGKS